MTEKIYLITTIRGNTLITPGKCWQFRVVSAAGDVQLNTDENDKVKVTVNAMGNVKTCTSAGSSDYASCS